MRANTARRLRAVKRSRVKPSWTRKSLNTYRLTYGRARPLFLTAQRALENARRDIAEVQKLEQDSRKDHLRSTSPSKPVGSMGHFAEAEYFNDCVIALKALEKALLAGS